MTRARSLADLLHGGPVDAEEVKRISEFLIFGWAGFWPKFVKFSCLLLLAASIATFGLLGDSVAAVIGAMIVAPLMLPIMGLAFSMSLGDRRRIGSTLLVSLAGMAMAVAMGFVLTLPIAGVMQAETIQQIMSRTAPHLFDLMAALVTGLAGAFALSRRDVSDTLPGVAIAVSLVPPLANVGILLALREPMLAAGSLLLFATKYVAILLTRSLVFLVMGFRQVATSPFDARAQRQALTIAVVALMLLVIPRSITSHRLVVTSRILSQTAAMGRQWLEGSGYRLMSVDAETADGTVNVLLMGSGSLPPLTSLEKQARGVLEGRPLRVKVVASQTFTVSTPPRGDGARREVGVLRASARQAGSAAS